MRLLGLGAAACAAHLVTGCYLEAGLGASAPRAGGTSDESVGPQAVAGVGLSGKGGPARFSVGPTFNLSSIETEQGRATTYGGVSVGTDVDLASRGDHLHVPVSVRLSILGGTLEGSGGFRAVAVTLGPSLEGVHGEHHDKSGLFTPAFRYMVTYGPDLATVHSFGFEIRIGHYWSPDAILD